MAHTEFASAVASLKNEGAYRVLENVIELEKQGRDIVHFEIGQSDYPTPPHVIQAGIEALNAGKTSYTNPSGTGELKAAIAKSVTATRGVDVSPESVVIGPGCKPGIFFTAMALLEKEDEIIFPNPGFPAYINIASVIGCKAVAVPYNERGDAFDFVALEAAINEKTRVVIINSPSNPTGGVTSAEDLAKFATIVKKWPRLWVFSDEIYALLVYDGEKVAPSFLTTASEHGLLDRTCMFDGASKSYCMTGWRLGWGILPVSLVERVHLLMVHTIGCTAQFTQVAAVAALEGSQDMLHTMVADYQKRRDYVVARLNAIPGITCHTPKGAFYAFPNVTATGLADREFADRALVEGGVAILPGSDFGSGGAGHIRISYVRNMDVLKKGLDRLEAFVKGLKL
eukprot:m.13732 g.13732  ORF g.13732 m.13732 type:complete len:398 (+) comp9830_c0_seq2:92-1285(+)